MTNQQLIKKLQQLPQDMEVMLVQTNDESEYNLVNTAEVRSITFGGDDIPREEWADVDCVVITDY